MKRFLLPVLICVLFTAIIGCEKKVDIHQLTTPPKPDLEKIKTELEIAQQVYADAWSKKDFDTISEIWSHDDDITIWGPAERDRVQGWEGPNGVKAWYLAAMEPLEKIDFKIHDVLVKVGDDGTSAVVTYYVENDFVDKDGNTGKMTPRVTVMKVKQNGKWKQIHGDASFSIAEIQAMK